MWGCGFVKDGQSERGSVWLWVCSGGAVCLGLWIVEVGLWLALDEKEEKSPERREEETEK